MVNKYHVDFFTILGYLASDERATKLDIETHPNQQQILEQRYGRLTGMRLVQDDINYYVWSEDANKWGSELRIY